MYYGSGTVDGITTGQPAEGRCLCTRQMAARFCVKWRHGRRLKNMTSYLKSYPLRQSMRIYLKKNPAKFHLDPI